MSAVETIYQQVENDLITRLTSVGVTSYVAEVMWDQVNVDKVEALVLARSCPPHLAIQIARYA